MSPMARRGVARGLLSQISRSLSRLPAPLLPSLLLPSLLPSFVFRLGLPLQRGSLLNPVVECWYRSGPPRMTRLPTWGGPRRPSGDLCGETGPAVFSLPDCLIGDLPSLFSLLSLLGARWGYPLSLVLLLCFLSPPLAAYWVTLTFFSSFGGFLISSSLFLGSSYDGVLLPLSSFCAFCLTVGFSSVLAAPTLPSVSSL